MATEMQLKVYLERNRMAARTLRKKVVSFSTLFLMFTFTWITEKELEPNFVGRKTEFKAAVRR